jgi:hypothetical protein
MPEEADVMNWRTLEYEPTTISKCCEIDIVMTFCILEKSSEAVLNRDDVDDEDDVEEAVEEGRIGWTECLPRLMVTMG